MEKAVIRLLNKLEEIGKSHEELYDTDVKEQAGQWFVEVFFNGRTNSPAPAEYGMFSEEGNKAIQAAFADFAEQLGESSSIIALAEEEKWKTFRAATTVSGQPAETFFGALAPDSPAAPATGQEGTAHWLRRASVYPLFLAAPGIFIFLIVVLAFPGLVDDPFKFFLFLLAAGVVSLIVGDSSWQFLSNRTYRKRHDNIS